MVNQWQLGQAPWRAPQQFPGRCRLIIDNDLAADPDGLVQLAHHLLSPSVDVRMVIASHLGPGPAGGIEQDESASAESAARDLFALMGLDAADLIVRGGDRMLAGPSVPAQSPAVERIIAEATREDATTPLVYAAGGGLTDLASALLLRPDIAERLTVVWIGGAEHPGIAVPPPGASPFEYNLGIDLFAAQVVFSTPGIDLWQVPRDAYRQLLISMAELRARLGGAGALGAYLYERIEHERTQACERAGHDVGESYVLGDSALVLLTALQSTFEPDPASSAWVTVPTPTISNQGQYVPNPDGSSLRVFTRLDGRLVFEDLFAKLDELARWQAS